MKIAQVSPLYEAVPPKTYGGTERIVSYLTEELVHQGHDVTLFASGDSHTEARLVPIVPEALRLNPRSVDQLAPHILEIKEVMERLDEFDIVHYSIDYLHYPFSGLCSTTTATVTTLHGRLDIPELQPLYTAFNNVPVISISDAQRSPLPMARWVGTVYHGLPEDLFSFHNNPEEYLVFLGRISPEKGVERAIEIAGRVGMPLKIAAKIAESDQKYFENEIKPLFDNPLVDFVGEVDERGKEELLGNAAALLFPINWPEPFGLVMIEAMACGTPVIAFRNGSVPEIMNNGVSGYIVGSVEEAVEATRQIDRISRWRCRMEFLSRFTAGRMAKDYLKIYQQLIYEQSQEETGEARPHKKVVYLDQQPPELCIG